MPTLSSFTDPIAELMLLLQRDGRPSLAWVIRWSENGADPLQIAWSVSRSADAMLALLQRIAPDRSEAFAEALERRLGPGWYHRDSLEIAVALREIFSPPPTMDLLLAR